MVSKKNIIRYILVFIIMVATIIFTLNKYSHVFPGSESALYGGGMETFYMLFDGNRVLLYFFIALVALPTLLYSYDTFSMNENKFNRQVILRVGLINYLVKSSFQSFLIAFVEFVMIAISALVLVGSFHMKVDIFDGAASSSYLVYSSTTFTNLIFFIIIGAIGYGVYSIFLFSLSHIITNKYVFAVSSLVIFFMSILAYFLLSSLLNNFFPISQYQNLHILTTLFVPINLFTPGFFTWGNGFYVFTIGLLTYLIMIYLLFLRFSFKVRKNG